MMVHDAQPFRMASSPWFRKLLKDLDCRVQLKSRHSYSKEVRKEGKVIKRRSREHVRRKVSVGYAATADMWTSKGQQDYLGINAHFIDPGGGRRLLLPVDLSTSSISRMP